MAAALSYKLKPIDKIVMIAGDAKIDMAKPVELTAYGSDGGGHV